MSGGVFLVDESVDDGVSVNHVNDLFVAVWSKN